MWSTYTWGFRWLTYQVTLVTVVVAALGLSGLSLPDDRQQEVGRVVGIDDVFCGG